MAAIAKELDRSTATGHSHNESIERQGYCAKCRRIKGTRDTQKASRVTL